jgi:hypothetical protein
VWLIVHELGFYVSAEKKINKQEKCEIQGIYKLSLLIPFQQ